MSLAIREKRREKAKQLLAEKNLIKKALCVGLILKNKSNDLWAFFLADASNPGQYRYQLFGAKGFYSHATFNSIEQAFDEAWVSGFRYIDRGALDRVSQTHEWRRGTVIQKIRDEYNSGKISFECMLEKLKEVED